MGLVATKFSSRRFRNFMSIDLMKFPLRSGYIIVLNEYTQIKYRNCLNSCYNCIKLRTNS